MISELKRRGVKGRLSKMKKHELDDLLQKSKPEQKLSVEDAPTEKKKTRGASAYHAFVRENIKKHGGDMKAVAAAYREQKGGGDAEKKPETEPETEQQGGNIMKKVGKHATKAVIDVGKGAAEAIGDAVKGGKDDAHDNFMEATHTYCDAQEGGGTDSDDDEHVSHYMKGGAYWDDESDDDDGKKKP